MRKYRRVTYEDRCQIDAFLSLGMNRAEIARRLIFHPSTIGRELRRNQYAQKYSPRKAHEKAQERYRSCRKPYLIHGPSAKLIDEKLASGWSPEQIAGRLRIEEVCLVSHQGVYDYIARNRVTLAPYLRKYGRRGGGRYAQRQGKRARMLSIKDRPSIVAKRKRRGDWERDGMYVANREQVLVITERKSRYTLLRAMGKGIPKEVTKITKQALSEVPIKSFTITNDNGPEFRDSLNQGVPVYHCTPGRPQQRGTVENTIGLLRQYISRKTDPSELDIERLKEIEDRINMRPRKCLDYRTPYEVLFKQKIALAI